MASPPPAPVPGEPDEDATSEDVSGSDAEEDQVELLVTSRAKRSTAGTRMSTLLEREGDDELELLFAEDEQEEDDEFEDDDVQAASDVQFDSGSSDDDQGPTKDDDDFEGEQELQKQARVERSKKRKAQDAFLKPGLLKKRPRFESRPTVAGTSTAPKTPAPKPKKKAERASWVPTPGEGPVRASSRKQTVENKEIVHSRLVASEKRRMKQLQVMQEAAKRKETSRPKAMTQAQRMEEAARTERSNAKSLNRWETSEKKRVEEQKAKLEALHNRQLTGPVISWWSGMARWVNGKLQKVGWKNIKEAEVKHTTNVQQERDLPNEEILSRSRKQPETAHDPGTNKVSGTQPRSSAADQNDTALDENSTSNQQMLLGPPEGPQGFLDGIHYYASLPEQPSSNSAQVRTDIYLDHHTSQQPREPVSPEPVGHEAHFASTVSNAAPSIVPAADYSARTLVILEDIDVNAQRLPDLHNHVLLKKRKATTSEKQKPIRELCVITEQPARYRDPLTGLPYADSYAYKEIQKLVNGGSRWSSLLGCYVGPTSSVARGVPERFWTNG